MAGIILKDGVGNELEYSDVKQIKIPYQDSEGKISAYKFTRIVNLNAYAIIGQGSTNNIANYTIIQLEDLIHKRQLKINFPKTFLI